MKPLATLLVLSAAVAAHAGQPRLVWETAGFHSPESVVFDPARQEYYVSNMGTFGQGATPGDGFISRVSAEGKILELQWVTGLSDPKGLALAGDRLYVGDDPGLAEIDLAAGRLVAWHAPADGKGDFNDCTADAAGNIYVCSGRLATVFRLHAGKLEPWYPLDKTKTGGINGLKAEADRLLLGGWSMRGADGREQLGHISFVAYADKQLGRLGTEPVCHVDGLESDGHGGYTVTDWLMGDVLHVTADGKTSPLLSLGKGTADHTYRADQRLLLIPQMLEHKLRAYHWAPAVD